MNRRCVIALDWLLPIVLLAGLTVWLRASDVDMEIQRQFYIDGWWPRGGHPILRAMRDYGVLPAWILAVSALVVWIASHWRPRLAHMRRAAAFLVIVMVVGPGLLVNSVFKDNWGRPRPRDVAEFGGDRAFAPVLNKGPRGRGNSFPSGHVATAFFLATPYFLYRRRSKLRAVAFLMMGASYATLMGLARMAQGKHFLSDVIWAAGIVYLCGLAVYYALGLHRDPPSTAT